MVSHVAADVVADPPGRVSGEAPLLLQVELVYRGEEPQRTFLHEVLEGYSRVLLVVAGVLRH